MTSSDLPPEAPATVPATAQPAAAPVTRAQWPSRNQAFGLVGAFLLGAFLCGGVGLAVGAVAGNFHSNHGPRQDGPGFHRRDGDEHRRKDGNLRPPRILPPHRPAPPALPPVVPATPPSPAPTASPS